MIKLVNPLHYPIAVFAGGVVLVAGVRWLQLPNVVAIPAAVGTAIAGSVALKAREPETFELGDPELERELQTLKQAALSVSQKATGLRSQAANLLTESFQLELLAAVELCCDRADALPGKVADLARRLQNSQTILSGSDLQRQLAAVERKLQSASGGARPHLEQLAASLQRNVQLAQAGEDTRFGQVVNLSTLIQDVAGTLQRLQTQLVSADVANPANLPQLQALSDELISLQESVEVLIRQ
jgi:hypothetical protein